MIDLRLKYGTNNIPLLSNETIDEHAELLIGDYDSSLLSKPQAIDVEDFAENYLGLQNTRTQWRAALIKASNHNTK